MSASLNPRRGSDPDASGHRARLGVRKHGATFTSYGPIPGLVNADLDVFPDSDAPALRWRISDRIDGWRWEITEEGGEA